MVLRDAQINASQLPETVDGQACSRQKREGKRKFHDHQSASQSAASGAAAGTPAFFQRVAQIPSRRLPSRSASAKYSRNQSRSEIEKQNRKIQVQIRFARKHEL